MIKSRRRTKPKWPAKLRAQAEVLLRQAHPAQPRLPATDLKRIIHELQIHQIELEMQDEELQRAQAETAAASRDCALFRTKED